MKPVLESILTNVESTRLSLEERILLGKYLAKTGDPRVITLSPVMISIPGGVYEIGSNDLEIETSYNEFAHLFKDFTIGEVKEWFYKEYPKHTVTIKPFKVSKYLITNDNFYQFKSEQGDQQLEFHFSLEKSNHPVTGINFDDARLYCEWLSKRTKRVFRLLTESEWEWLAGSGKNYRFPWGNKFDCSRANTSEIGLRDTTAVGIFPQGNSEQGLTDLAGNVEEWVDSVYAPYTGGKIVKDRIYHFNNGSYNILRGGCYNLHGDLCISTRRHGFFPDYSITGFRIAETI